MSTLSYYSCSIGMKVLLTCPNKGYLIGRDNPAINTKWECEGVITEKYNGAINVVWNNGRGNSYKKRRIIGCYEQGLY